MLYERMNIVNSAYYTVPSIECKRFSILRLIHNCYIHSSSNVPYTIADTPKLKTDIFHARSRRNDGFMQNGIIKATWQYSYLKWGKKQRNF